MVELTKDERLVLFEFLHRFCETERIAFSHHAEAVVLDKIAGDLERELAEPFSESYPELLKAARERTIAQYESHMGAGSWIRELPLDQV